MKRLVFDIQSDSFSQSFLRADSEEHRELHAPELRVACVFDEPSRKLSFYTPGNADVLVSVLQAADEIVSFNGTALGLLVLRKHYGLPGRVPRTGRHVDLHTVMSEMSGFRVSLNLALQLNLNQSKHTDGGSIAELNIRKLKIARKSDVRQIYRLWQLWADGKLSVAQRNQGRPGHGSEYSAPGPTHHTPSECPNCQDVGSLEPKRGDAETMTGEQVADPAMEMPGTLVCHTCDFEFDWG